MKRAQSRGEILAQGDVSTLSLSEAKKQAVREAMYRPLCSHTIPKEDPSIYDEVYWQCMTKLAREEMQEAWPKGLSGAWVLFVQVLHKQLPVERRPGRRAAAGEAARLLVPLANEPFRWFASGRKRWELRRLGRKITPRNLVVGRRVELRRGYSHQNGAIWGTLADIRAADNVADFFAHIDYRQVIPVAHDRAEAVQIASKILGDARAPVIGFRIAPDSITEPPLSEKQSAEHVH